MSEVWALGTRARKPAPRTSGGRAREGVAKNTGRRAHRKASVATTDGPLGPSLARSRSARCRPGARRRRGDPFAPLGILRRHSPTKVSSTLKRTALAGGARSRSFGFALTPAPSFRTCVSVLHAKSKRGRSAAAARPSPGGHFSHNIPDWKYSRLENRASLF